jgi:hypothetical protein
MPIQPSFAAKPYVRSSPSLWDLERDKRRRAIEPNATSITERVPIGRRNVRQILLETSRTNTDPTTNVRVTITSVTLRLISVLNARTAAPALRAVWDLPER